VHHHQVEGLTLDLARHRLVGRIGCGARIERRQTAADLLSSHLKMALERVGRHSMAEDRRSRMSQLGDLRA
jgi:hypothetical protein